MSVGAAPEIAEDDDGDVETEVDGAPEGEPPDGPDVAGDGEPPDEPVDETPEGDPDIEEVDLTEDDTLSGGNDLFTGTDDADDSDSVEDVQEEEAESDDEDGDDGDALDGLDDRGEAAEEAINEGVARLFVVGLEEDEQEELRGEFEEVFEAFRLGYFGSRFLDEYVFAPDDEEIDPTYGLIGAMLCCGAFAVWMRPDSDELIGDAKDAISNLSGGLA